MYDREISVLATKVETYEKTRERFDLEARLSKLRFENLLEACAKYRP